MVGELETQNIIRLKHWMHFARKLD